MTARAPLPPVPVEDDPDTGGFFAAARRGQLAVCRCENCGTYLHLPRAYCSACGSFDAGWVTVAGSATLYSYTIVEHQVHPAFPTPYAIVLVELDDVPGLRLVGYLAGRPSLTVGMPMHATFNHEVVDSIPLPQWVATIDTPHVAGDSESVSPATNREDTQR